ncbi:aldehyde dehydrogenase family protein [Stenomitos frigidus]|uniref:NAD-dependent aldehyde dehydrogenase n=1 Tax=Stenomitos frigidus ULC18 TaxID=2107698 RepID=A0A2T1ER47_9CYAN|nr:aldehyde dehydrogenase family protein [Stenomitos frigidus]PSB35181.1 NAD-dependent aldehyde dehydrogenase [Stenomitos frigidus ULC18]
MVTRQTNPVNSTSLAQADAIVTRLSSHKDDWVRVSIADRIAYLERCLDEVMAVAQDWADACCRAKGINPEATLAGEEWFVGPAATLGNLRWLINTLKANGQPSVKLRAYNEQTIAQVFPNTLMERLLWLGFAGEVWMQPGKAATQGMVYRQPSPEGTLALVLGAGNVSAIAPMDALYKLFAEDAVVLLKMNPVNEYMGPILEAAFRSLQQDGFFEVVYGGADLGRHLCQHPLVDTIHITGSHQTHDAIVWGDTPTEQAQRQSAKQPRTTKPITSELGCVTPVIVVPGDWTTADIAFQARHIAGMVVHNASFNCAAAKVVVTAKGWAQRDAFLAQLQQELAQTPARNAYYPGAKARYQAFLERYPHAIALPTLANGSASLQPQDALPWALIPDVTPQAGEYGLTQEAFCGVLAEVSLDTSEPGAFLAQAVDFVNEQVWGNLSCTVLIDSQTQRQWRKELESAIAQLHYGAIGVNVWSGVLFSLSVFPWGAFPGNPLHDITSGQGFVHNVYLFEQPQKAVLRAPFRILPLPIWFARHQNLLALAQHFTAFQAHPSWQRFFRVVLAAVRG